MAYTPSVHGRMPYLPLPEGKGNVRPWSAETILLRLSAEGRAVHGITVNQ